jgi:polysaccharide pyruvyl transferase WcaK-like protein
MMLVAVFQSVMLLQSKFCTCLYASVRDTVSVRGLTAVAAAASTRGSPSPAPEKEGEEKKQQRGASCSRRQGRSARTIAREETSICRFALRRLHPGLRCRPLHGGGNDNRLGSNWMLVLLYFYLTYH